MRHSGATPHLRIMAMAYFFSNVSPASDSPDRMPGSPRERFSLLAGMALMASLMLVSCGDDPLTSRYGGLPAAFGKANKLTVIADSTWWAEGLHDSVDFTFGAPVLILPAPEPLYDLTHFTLRDLEANPARRELRAYFLISHNGLRGTPLDDLMRKDLGDSLLPPGAPYTVKLIRNRWASGQMQVYIYGQDQQAVYRAIAERGPALLAKLSEHDQEILESQTYAARENAILARRVREHTGMTFRIPGEYLEALEQDSVLWLRKELKDMTLGLLFQRIPYQSQEQFEKEGFREIHDRMTAIISSPQPNLVTRLIIDDRYLPLFFSPLSIGGQYAMEVRGLWRMENDVMGGPFIACVIQSPDQRDLVLATGFIYGPGKKKREWMQQLEIILRSGRFSAGSI
jgi:hypothetical protein